MPYQFLNDGLYLLRSPSYAKFVEYHYTVLDVGNRLGYSDVDLTHPVMVHQTPPMLRRDRFDDSRLWEVLAVVPTHDEPVAIARLSYACQDPSYRQLGHNCEQFARYVVTGRWESFQVRKAFVICGALAFGIKVLSDSAEEERLARERVRRARARRRLRAMGFA